MTPAALVDTSLSALSISSTIDVPKTFVRTGPDLVTVFVLQALVLVIDPCKPTVFDDARNPRTFTCSRRSESLVPFWSWFVVVTSIRFVTHPARMITAAMLNDVLNLFFMVSFRVVFAACRFSITLG